MIKYDDILVLATLIMWGRTTQYDYAEQIISYIMIDAKNIFQLFSAIKRSIDLQQDT